MKKTLAIFVALMMLMSAFACTAAPAEDPATEEPEAVVTDVPAPEELPNVELTLWASELEDFQAAVRVMANAFIENYASEANIVINIGAQSESQTKDTVLVDIAAAADVYYFADDQTRELVAAGALQPVQNANAVAAANAQGAVDAATVDGTLYAYPAMGGNGYFLYYNSNIISAEQAATWDGILKACNAAGVKATMEMTNAWYSYGFFAGAGYACALSDDGKTTTCDWNAEGGVNVLQAMLDIAANSAYINLTDGEFVSGAKEGTIAAGINGSWNAASIAEAFGDGYATAKLPTFTLNGEQVQMGSFDGYKFVGVNAMSENVGWAMRLAEWLTNEDNQVYLYEATNGAAVPANTNAAASEAVQANPVVAALAAQSQYATAQSLSVGGNYWTPANALGTIVVNGNPDGLELQAILDECVAGITALVE